MKKLKNMNKAQKQVLTLVLFGGFVFILFLFLTYTLLATESFLTNSGSSQEDAEKIYSDPENHGDADPERGLELAELTTKAPHQGTFFSLLLNEEEGKFVVQIDPSNRIEGLREFNQYLLDNNLSFQDVELYIDHSNSNL